MQLVFLLRYVEVDDESLIRIAGRMWRVGSTEVGCSHGIWMDRLDVVGGIRDHFECARGL